MSENAVKRSVLCRPESSVIQKLSVIIIIKSRYVCQSFIVLLKHSFLYCYGYQSVYIIDKIIYIFLLKHLSFAV